MPRTHRLVLLLWVLLLATVSATAKPRARHVIIISFDGGKPAVMRESKMPVVFAMARQGAATWEAKTVLPSITLVNHTSMLTGVQPAKHGIVWNDWLPERGLPKTDTIFKLARAKDLTTALFAGKEKFAHLMQPGSLNQLVLSSHGARKLAEEAARYIVAYKPNLCFVHFTDTDSTGHRYGWGSPEQRRAFAEEDAGVNILRRAVQKAGMAGETVFILSADHGGHEKTHGSDSPEDTTIPWIAWGAGVRPEYAIQAPVITCDTAATALWLLGVPVPETFDGKPVTSAFEPMTTVAEARP